MATLIADPQLEERLKAERQAWGADHHDEVWEGVYFMPPLPNNEHQELVMSLAYVLKAAVGTPGLGQVFPGVNLAGSSDNWEDDYRVPDVAVFLQGGSAENCGAYWRGAADFLVEIVSPGDRTYDKIPFYSRLGVVELLIVNRHPWALELLRHQEGRLQSVGEATLKDGHTLVSTVVPLQFRLVPGRFRPAIEVRHQETGERWMV